MGQVVATLYSGLSNASSLADAYVVPGQGRVALRGSGRDMETDGFSRFLSV